jgi:predicted nucleic acid-binding protein
VVSTQVIQEFYVAGVSKLKIDPFLVKNMVRAFEHLEIEDLNPGQIIRGVKVINPFTDPMR